MNLITAFVTLFFLISISYIIYDALLHQTNPNFGNTSAKKIFNSPHNNIFVIEKSDDNNYMGPYRQNPQKDDFRKFITDQPFFDTIVSFHAPWCKKCQKMRDIIFSVSSEVDGDFYLRCLLISYDGDQLTELEKQNFEPILFWKRNQQDPLVYRQQTSVDGVMRWLKKVSSTQFSNPNYRYLGERTTKRIVKWLSRCFSYPFNHKLYAYNGQMTVNCLARTIKRYIPFIGNETVQDQLQPDYYIYYDQNEKECENDF